MKRCLVCITDHDETHATCPLCGEGSWMTLVSEPESASEEPSTDAGADAQPMSKRWSRRR